MDDRYRKARVLVAGWKARNLEGMQRDSNMIGAAFGRRIAHKEISDDPALVIYVAKKVPTRKSRNGQFTLSAGRTVR